LRGYMHSCWMNHAYGNEFVRINQQFKTIPSPSTTSKKQHESIARLSNMRHPR